MSIFTEIIGGGLGQLIKDVVGSFKLSPEEKLKFEQLLVQHEHEIKLKEMELTVKSMDAESKAIETDSANIKAEAQLGDKYTSRMRPTFGYMMIFVLGWNFVICPLLGNNPIEFPEALFWLFGSVMLGYTGARTWEKIGMGKGGFTIGGKKLAKLSTSSSVSSSISLGLS